MNIKVLAGILGAVAVISFMQVISAAPAFAQAPTSTEISIEVPNLLSCSAPGKSDFECLVDKIFTFLWYLSFPIVTIMVLVGAYQLMTSQGAEEKVTAGKRTITWAIVGFVVLILARSVVYIITNLISSLGSGS
jgi:hypothetical protein